MGNIWRIMFLKSDKKFPYMYWVHTAPNSFTFLPVLYIVSSLRMKVDSKWRWFYHPSSPYHSIRLCENLRTYPGFEFITFTFSENSNYWRESLLEVIGQNIAGWCQQTFCFQKFVENTQQCFAFTPQGNFTAHNLNFHWRWRWWDQIQSWRLG